MPNAFSLSHSLAPSPHHSLTLSLDHSITPSLPHPLTSTLPHSLFVCEVDGPDTHDQSSWPDASAGHAERKHRHDTPVSRGLHAARELIIHIHTHMRAIMYEACCRGRRRPTQQTKAATKDDKPTTTSEASEADGREAARRKRRGGEKMQQQRQSKGPEPEGGQGAHPESRGAARRRSEQKRARTLTAAWPLGRRQRRRAGTQTRAVDTNGAALGIVRTRLRGRSCVRTREPHPQACRGPRWRTGSPAGWGM